MVTTRKTGLLLLFLHESSFSKIRCVIDYYNCHLPIQKNKRCAPPIPNTSLTPSPNPLKSHALPPRRTVRHGSPLPQTPPLGYHPFPTGARNHDHIRHHTPKCLRHLDGQNHPVRHHPHPARAAHRHYWPQWVWQDHPAAPDGGADPAHHRGCPDRRA